MSTASAPPPRLLPVGDAALAVEFADAYDPAAAARVLRLDRQLAGRVHVTKGVLECVPTLRSLLIHYDPVRLSLRRLTALLRALPEAAEAAEARAAAWCLPVCYEGGHAPDLTELAERLGLAHEAAVGLHAGGRYRAAMVGGYPGFAYLSGLDPCLTAPRRASPRLTVPEGSVGVANAFTGIYPAAVPGGWHLIGRTPVPLFDHGRSERPALIAAGDRVTFRRIDAAAFGEFQAAFREKRADPVEACRAP